MFGAYINEPNANEQPNVHWVIPKKIAKPVMVGIKTTKEILAGKELLVDYNISMPDSNKKKKQAAIKTTGKQTNKK